MKYLGIIGFLVLTSCTKKEYSAELHEDAIVVDTVYTPATHGFGVGVGVAPNGDTVVTPVSVDTSPVYAVVFQCQHGKFIIESSKEAYRLFQTLKRDQHVDVTYREIYAIKDDGRHLIGYDFIAATPKRGSE
jgi:hypothetical protein